MKYFAFFHASVLALLLILIWSEINTPRHVTAAVTLVVIFVGYVTIMIIGGVQVCKHLKKRESLVVRLYSNDV